MVGGGVFGVKKGVYLLSNQLHGPLPVVFGNNYRHLEHVNSLGDFINCEILRSLGSCGRLRKHLYFR